ncbi:MAG: hypothetical protein HY347_00530 [candidate division NC10 bacterium]|nr:hypothetical protein [candidate division NC10 bacterium]
MGVHVVGQVTVTIDDALSGESEIRVRAVPERTTNDLGIPVVIETTRGELRVVVYLDHLAIRLAPDVTLTVRPTEAAVEIPMREFLGTTPVLEIRADPLAGNQAWTQKELLARLPEVQGAIVRLVPPAQVCEALFQPSLATWLRETRERRAAPPDQDSGGSE